jgi:hypothetical protein
MAFIEEIDYPITLVLKPACWYQITSSEDVKKAWEEGKDFLMLNTSQYCSIRDIEFLKEEYQNSICP